MSSLRRVILAMLFVLSLTAVVAWAQDDAPQKGDPPGRAVRLQYMSGSVSIQPAGNGDWVEGALNRPLTNSDNIWSDKSSRAELNVGTGILRMGDETSVTLTNVGDNNAQVELHQGTLNLHVRHLFEGEIYEIDTPNLAFTVQKSGDYRFDVDPNGDATVVTVRKGEGDATGQGPGVRVHSDQQVRFTNETSLTHEVAEAPAYDGFDSWCAVRDKRLDTSLSARYVAPGTVGYEDLDDNGVWTEEPPYGRVWRPVQAPGWAPYEFGHWVWVSPWGWTWVDDASWGYAPFHYGRWVYASGYWGWAPGPLYVRPFYAPALVAWFGGPGWGVSLGFGVGGGYGWCPLGWGEPFYPWYGGSRYYFRNVNIRNTRIANINNYYGHPPDRFGHGSTRYANMRAPGGFTAVPSRTLANGVPVRGTAVRVSGRQLANAPMGRVNIAPTRIAMLGPGAGRSAAIPPARSGTRPTVSRASVSTGFGHGGNQAGGFNNQKPFAGRTESGAPSRVSTNSPGRGPNSAVASNISRNMPNQANAGPSRGLRSQTMHNVPRPPQGGMSGRPAASDMSGRPQMSSDSQARGTFSPSSTQRSVPRPPASFGSRGSQPMTQRSEASPAMQPSRNRPTTAVPRPSGPIRPASDYNRMSNNSSSRPNYSPSNGGGYGGSSRQPSYSPSDRGGNSNSPRYSSPSYGTPRSASPQSSAPRSAPQYSAPRYGGSPSYGSSPSYRSSGPSYSAPSYRGGGSSMGGGAPSHSAPPYGGGGGSYRGGGGGGGGGSSSHSGGGGGGSRGSSGGGHGGRR